MVLTQAFNLDIVKQPLQRLKLVNGDTANQFVITITNNGAAVTLDTSLHKVIAVFKRADGQVYTQDAAHGLSFTSGGVVTIDLYSSSFRTGTNKITLQIYKRENSSATEYPLLLTTQEQSFNARAAAIPEAGAPNAPSQLPMLEQIIHDAGEAVTNCNTAAAAANAAATSANNAAASANSAASSANSAASAANSAAADATNAANAAWIRVDACDIALENVLTATAAANDAATAANARAAQCVEAAADAGAAANDALDAAAEAEDAADAANTAAEMLNGLLENIDDEPTQSSDHLVKSGGVYSWTSDLVQEAADDVRAQIPAGATANPLMDGTAAKGSSTKWAREDHVHPHDTAKQDVLTFDNAPTAGSNNPVKSGGIKTAIDNAAAAAAKKNAYLVKHDGVSTGWSNNELMTYADDSGTELEAIGADTLFATQVELASGETVTLYETYRANDNVYLRSESVNGKYVTADFSFSTHHQTQLIFVLHYDESPLQLHIASTQESNGTTYVTFAEGEAAAIYAGRHTRDMWLEYETSRDVSGMTVTTSTVMRKRNVFEQNDANNTTLVYLGYVRVPSGIAEEKGISVYFQNGEFYAATYE